MSIGSGYVLAGSGFLLERPSHPLFRLQAVGGDGG
jgi:hypothetical protein